MIALTRELVDSCFGDRPHRYVDRVPSTMDAARAWLAEGAPHGAALLAGEQTAGRGRMGRVWLDADGAAIAMSLVLRLPSAALPQVPMYGGLAVHDALSALGVPGVTLKWPNDILAGDKKLCGVLAEAVWDGGALTGAVLGIGLNVSGGFDSPELAETATTVAAALGTEADAGRVLSALVGCLYARLPDLNTPMLYHAWRARLGTIGRRVRVEGSSAYEGVAEDASDMGALLVRADDGQLRTVLAGDVRLRPALG
jgi:BirA family biotin operon repressor/biotin-[acetyl-CoA-carboxylase] ligase